MAVEILDPANQPLLFEPTVRQNITAGTNIKTVNFMAEHDAKQRGESRVLQAPLRPGPPDLKLH